MGISEHCVPPSWDATGGRLSRWSQPGCCDPSPSSLAAPGAAVAEATHLWCHLWVHFSVTYKGSLGKEGGSQRWIVIRF